MITIGRSSNGRTLPSGGSYLGPTPSLPALRRFFITKKVPINRYFFRFVNRLLELCHYRFVMNDDSGAKVLLPEASIASITK